jgi:hypothetical protein
MLEKEERQGKVDDSQSYRSSSGFGNTIVSSHQRAAKRDASDFLFIRQW